MLIASAKGPVTCGFNRYIVECKLISLILHVDGKAIDLIDT